MRNEEIERRIAAAPEPFRLELEDLRRRGIIQADGSIIPCVREALAKVLKRLIEEERAAKAVQRRELPPALPEVGVQNPPQKQAHKSLGFTKKPRSQK